ncbi:unnamed protein product, partial [Polarella glacialis]
VSSQQPERRTSFQDEAVLMGPSALVALRPPGLGGRASEQRGAALGAGRSTVGASWALRQKSRLQRPDEAPVFFIPKSPEEESQFAAEAAAAALLGAAKPWAGWVRPQRQSTTLRAMAQAAGGCSALSSAGLELLGAGSGAALRAPGNSTP